MNYCGMQEYRRMIAVTILSKKDYTQSDALFTYIQFMP